MMSSISQAFSIDANHDFLFFTGRQHTINIILDNPNTTIDINEASPGEVYMM